MQNIKNVYKIQSSWNGRQSVRWSSGRIDARSQHGHGDRAPENHEATPTTVQLHHHDLHDTTSAKKGHFISAQQKKLSDATIIAQRLPRTRRSPRKINPTQPYCLCTSPRAQQRLLLSVTLTLGASISISETPRSCTWDIVHFSRRATVGCNDRGTNACTEAR